MVDLTRFLEDGAVPIGFAGSVKFLDPEGSVQIINVRAEVPSWEAVGMVTSCLDDFRAKMQWTSDD